MSEKKSVRRKKKGKLERKLLRNLMFIFLIIMFSTSVAIILTSFEDAMELRKKDILVTSTLAESCIEFVFEENVDYYHSNGDAIDHWLEYGVDEYYEAASNKFYEFKHLFNCNDVYVYKAQRDENGNIINNMDIVFDTPDERGVIHYQIGNNFGPSQAYRTIKKVYETGVAQSHDTLAVNDSGFVIAAFAPVFYGDGTVCAVIGIEASVSMIFLETLGANYVMLIDTAVNFLLFAAIIFLFIKKSVVKPVNTISLHMNKFVSDEGQLDFEPIDEIHTKDEIEQIAEDFNSLAQRTIDFTKNLELKTSEEQRLRLDLDVASQIRNVVSSELTYPPFPERTDFDLCASLNYTMYNRCSFCNYFFTDTDHLFIVAGEPLGDSLASMIFSIVSASHIKSFAKLGFEPYKIAMETNNELCSIEKTDAGLTVGIIIIDIELKTGVMKYVNAGMPPILIKKPGENYTTEKPEKPFSLGQMRGVSFEQKTVQLNQGSTFLLTSFGVTGMSDPKGMKYGLERLTDVMNKNSGSVYDLDKTVKQLEKDLDDFRDGSPVSRDTMILGFRYFG